jgi:hypothetical protein
VDGGRAAQLSVGGYSRTPEEPQRAPGALEPAYQGHAEPLDELAHVVGHLARLVVVLAGQAVVPALFLGSLLASSLAGSPLAVNLGYLPLPILPPNLLKNMVPRVGFELTTYRLRSGCSTAELSGRWRLLRRLSI